MARDEEDFRCALPGGYCPGGAGSRPTRIEWASHVTGSENTGLSLVGPELEEEAAVGFQG